MVLTHSRAFWNIFSQGEAIWFFFNLSGIHGHCHVRNVLSGWGMRARCLPSGEHRPAIPFAEPFGLKGYFKVTSLLSSIYRIGASFSFSWGERERLLPFAHKCYRRGACGLCFPSLEGRGLRGGFLEVTVREKYDSFFNIIAVLLLWNNNPYNSLPEKMASCSIWRDVLRHVRMFRPRRSVALHQLLQWWELMGYGCAIFKIF